MISVKNSIENRRENNKSNCLSKNRKMRVIISWSVEKKWKEIWLSFDDMYNFIKNYWNSWFIELCSPLPWVIAYKWYISKVNRLIVFIVNKKGIIYPVYVWNKNDDIAKNITVSKIREMALQWQEKILFDIEKRNIKIRHF